MKNEKKSSNVFFTCLTAINIYIMAYLVNFYKIFHLFLKFLIKLDMKLSKLIIDSMINLRKAFLIYLKIAKIIREKKKTTKENLMII